MSADQVLVGVGIGIVLGATWFTVAYKFLFPFFPKVVSSGLGQLLMLRDGARIKNILIFEDEAYKNFHETSQYTQKSR